MQDEPTPSPQPSGEANQKSSESDVGITSLTPQQPQTEECNPSKPSKKCSWWHVWWPRGKTAWYLFGEMVTLLWAIALWDSYRPKITITPGGTLDSKSPFATYFIMQNQGALPISHITYRTQLKAVAAGSTNPVDYVSQEQNVSVIPQMQSLESYTLGIHYASVQINMHTVPMTTNHVMATNQVVPPGETQILELLLSFDVSYKPKFFGKRTDTLYFFGVPDVDGNWQWLPSAHQSVTDQTIDTNLLVPVKPAPTPTSTNGGTQVHTN